MQYETKLIMVGKAMLMGIVTGVFVSVFLSGFGAGYVVFHCHHPNVDATTDDTDNE